MEGKKGAVWITGASSGIGKALTFEFTKNNFLVVGTARRTELLQEIKKELGEFGNNFEFYSLDITDKKSVVQFYSNISSNYQIDCLINNAGTTSFKTAINDSLDEIENIIKVNLLGSIYSIKSVLPDMMERESGTIINILSVVTQKIFTGSSAYSASKSGLLAYSKVIREELREKNIRIINVSPGATATSIWSDKVLQKYSERMMNPKSIAGLIFKIFVDASNMVVEDIFIKPLKGDL